MSDAAQAAAIAALATLIVSGFQGLRWWVERRDAQRKERQAEATRELSETEAGKTIRTLERQNRQLERRNDSLRRELVELAVAVADREEARLRRRQEP